MKLKENKAKHNPNEEHDWELVEQTEGLDKDFERKIDKLEDDIKERLSKKKNK